MRRQGSLTTICNQTVEDVCLLQRQADSPASAGSDSESLGAARGGGVRIGEPTPLFEKHSSRGAHAPPSPTGPNPGPGGSRGSPGPAGVLSWAGGPALHAEAPVCVIIGAAGPPSGRP